MDAKPWVASAARVPSPANSTRERWIIEPISTFPVSPSGSSADRKLAGRPGPGFTERSRSMISTAAGSFVKPHPRGRKV